VTAYEHSRFMPTDFLYSPPSVIPGYPVRQPARIWKGSPDDGSPSLGLVTSGEATNGQFYSDLFVCLDG
jgi:hypothetical protein